MRAAARPSTAVNSPGLSVLMATHNGADTLERTLRAMSELIAPAGGWRLVVVDNASTDETAEILARWRERLPLACISEPVLGKSTAMNTALKQATGDFIVMTDDDVLPDGDWLVEWRRVADSYPQIDLFGGAIIPHFDSGPPVWNMPEACLTVLYAQTPQLAEGEIAPYDVSGGNMAIRSALRDEGWGFGGGFMVGGSGLMGEDSDFVRRVAAAGHKVGFAPTARVGHIVNAEQTRWLWIQKRFFRSGRAMFVFDDLKRDDKGRALIVFPWWRLRRAAARALRLTVPTNKRQRTVRFMGTRELAYDLGAITQAILLVFGL